MGRPLKTIKYNEELDIDVDTGFPTGLAPNNDYDITKPGVVGGWPERDRQVYSQVCIEQVGGGTITANTASAVVTGVGTNFSQAQIAGAKVYNSAGVLLGTVTSIANATSLTFTANCTTNVTAGSFTFSTIDDGYIIRQKGKKKFLVARKQTIQDEGIAQGGTYMITDASNTDWTALGAGTNAANGKIFTSTASGNGLATNGTVYAVNTCVLVNGGTLGLNQMSIQITNDGDNTNAMSLTNHWTRDFDNSDNANGVRYLASFDNHGGNIDTATGSTIVRIQDWYC